MGEIAFLSFGMRQRKEMTNTNHLMGGVALAPLWYQLLLTLENQLAEQGNTLDNGERLKLVVDYPEDTPESSKVAKFPPAQFASLTHHGIYDGHAIATACHIQTTGRALTYPNDHLLQQNHPVRDGGKK